MGRDDASMIRFVLMKSIEQERVGRTDWMCMYGRGVSRNDAVAVQWCFIAAKYRHADANQSVAYMNGCDFAVAENKKVALIGTSKPLYKVTLTHNAVVENRRRRFGCQKNRLKAVS